MKQPKLCKQPNCPHEANRREEILKFANALVIDISHPENIYPVMDADELKYFTKNLSNRVNESFTAWYFLKLREMNKPK